MFSFGKDNHKYVTSRERLGKWEVVRDDGQVEHLEKLPPDSKLVDRVMLPGVRLASQRTIEDVLAVQRRRLEALAESRRTRRKSQQSAKPKASRPHKGVAAALDGLPPDLQAIALQKLSKKGKQ